MSSCSYSECNNVLNMNGRVLQVGPQAFFTCTGLTLLPYAEFKMKVLDVKAHTHVQSLRLESSSDL